MISADDALAVEITGRIEHPRIITFGTAERAEVRLVDVEPDGAGVRFGIVVDGERHQGALPVPGHHNALNAAGAVAVLRQLGIPADRAVAALAAFGGTKRRFDLQGVVDGVSVYDDYAHHPVEVEAALTAARGVVGDGRILAVHQPHLYSRTMAMSDEFAEVLERLADRTIVLEVDGAREDPVPGVTGEYVSREFADPARVEYCPEWPDAARAVAEWARPGDFVITLGCGNVNRIVPQLLAALDERAPRADAHEA